MSLHRLLTAAFAALILSGGAVAAADLGGNCCADLEERVAELEATTARKGNRKVTLTVYGQVNKSMVWVDGLVNGRDSKGNLTTTSRNGVVENSVSPSSFGFTGMGRVNADVTLGYKLEVQLLPDNSHIPNVDEPLAVRHNFAWIESKTLGKVSLGFTSMATDKITRATTANTDFVAPMLSFGALTGTVLPVDLPFNEIRRNVARYDSPALMGFMISASIANSDGFPSVSPAADGHAMDIALRYANEIAGMFRIAAGIGFRDEDQQLVGPYQWVGRGQVISGSASAMHIPSGIFVNAAYGKTKDEAGNFFSSLPATRTGGADLKAWAFQGGIEKRFFELGATTAYVEYQNAKASANLALVGPPSSNIVSGSIEPTFWGLGLVQRVDGANADVYLSYRKYQWDVDVKRGTSTVNLPDVPDTSVIMGGIRIGF